jgi:hypothetical protein
MDSDSDLKLDFRILFVNRLQQMASWQGERARVMQMKNQRFLFPAEQQRTAEDDPLGKQRTAEYDPLGKQRMILEVRWRTADDNFLGK